MRRASLLLKSNDANGARRSSAAQSLSTNDENEGDMDKDPRTAMQKKTFRRWCNSYLDDRGLYVNHILKDWEDGINLINLLEVLSESSLPKYNKTPKLKAHKIENLNNALKFITNVAKIQLVNIGSEDLFKGNQTIVLGLIWTLILRWGLKLKDGKSGLLNWAIARSKDSGVDVKNFTTSWQDGMAFCALIHAHRPDLININECSPSQPLENMERAFSAAEKGLEVERLLDPNDVLANPDEKSIIAYVGQLHTAFNSHPKPKDDNAATAATPTAATAATASAPAKRASVAAPPKRASVTTGSGAAAAAVAAVTAAAPNSTDPNKDTSKGDNDLGAGNDRGTSDAANNGDGNPNAATNGNDDTSNGSGYPVEETNVLIPIEEKKEEEKPEPGLHAPDAPQASEPGTSTINVQWNVVPHATKTRVQIIEDGGNWDKPLKSEDHPVSSSSCIVKGLSPGKDYKVRVIAMKSGLLSSKESDPSEETPFSTRAIGAPKAPHVTASTMTTADLEWESPENSNGVVLQYCEEPFDWNNPSSVALGEGVTNHKVEGLKPGTKYEFRLIADTNDGQSPPSVTTESVTGFPQMDTPTTSNVSESTVQLSWPSFPNATSYQVEILTYDKDEAKTAANPPPEEAWEHARKAVTTGSPVVVDELPAGTTNHFRVIAITPNGESQPSDSACVEMAAAAMSSPIIDMAGDNALDIAWDPYPNAVKYRVEIRDPDNEDWKDARVEEVEAPQTSTKVFEIEPDSNYEIRLVPVFAEGEGEGEPSFAVPIRTPSNTKVFGKIALVTGANSKKGCEMVRSLAKEGNSFWSWSSGYSKIFVCAYRPSPELKELASKFDQVIILEMDTTKPESVKEAARQLHLQAPYIDVFINNAGFSPETIGLLMSRPN